MKKATITFLLSIFSIVLFAQDFEVPKNYTLSQAEDYAQYEEDILKCIDWLVQTPHNEQASKRESTNSFLLAWLTGSPNVTIVLKAEIVTFIDETTPELLMIFLGGWTKYTLESDGSKDEVSGNLAGIEAVIEYYKKNKDFLPKNKNVEKYIKMKNKGKLKDFVESNI